MKKVLFAVLLFLVWITILVPLALILFLFTSVVGWLIYAVAKITDSIQSRPIGGRTSEVVEDSIFLAYALVCAIMIIPFEYRSWYRFMH